MARSRFVPSDGRSRCAWALASELELNYHDREWGLPVHEDRVFFEFLVLESAQAGLRWSTILGKREGYRRLFAGFEPQQVAAFSPQQVEALLGDASIVRNRAKIQAAVNNACRFLALQEEFGSFDRYIWRFAGGQPRQNHWQSLAEVPASTEESEALSRDLKGRGFRFIGSTICYALMQATGLVNDHLESCYRHSACSAPG